jgi:hypothetical protein
MALAMVSLLAGLGGGLARLGWPTMPTSSAVAFHGPLMVGGFLGTLIGLERAVALGHGWAYLAPVASGLGALALIANVPGAGWLMALGSAVLAIACIDIVRRQPATFTVIMALGAVSWLCGQTAWLAGQRISQVVFWWIGFLVLTIAGERLELTRLLRLGRLVRGSFIAVIALFLGGLIVTARAPRHGTGIAGAALIALAVWLGIWDVARRTVRASGLTRFIAIALLAGYVWLVLAGALAVHGTGEAGSLYDAMLHAVFVGFAVSMIFGHAPIIFPAVVSVPIAYRPTFYLHLGLLHASLVLRVGGDLMAWLPGRRWGGLLNAVAIVLFFVNTAYGAVRRSAAG